uniref:Mde8i18_2 n=1 Tax=Mayetiola destructor TaxID=39758 RepID=Q3HM48_MAYDE|nr:Mde8i18_2 [Mayetiola destructor]
MDRNIEFLQNSSDKCRESDHCTLKKIELKTNGGTVSRGSCSDHLADGCVIYNGLDDKTGKQLCIIEWKIQFNQIKTANLNKDAALHLISNMKANIENRMKQMNKLKHENLINYDTLTWSSDENGVSIYLIRDYYEQSFKKINQTVGWTNESAQKVTLSLLNAVKYLHDNGYAHGNINESTVFVGNAGNCKVADFGLIPYLNGIKDNIDNINHFNEPLISMDFPAIGDLIDTFGLKFGKISDFIVNCKSRSFNAGMDWLLRHPFLTESTISSPFHENYKLIKPLGGGGFGVVLKVKHYHDQWKYALKFVKLEKEMDKNEPILAEVNILAKLKHDNIVGYNTCWPQKLDITEYKKYGDKNVDDNEAMETDTESAFGSCSIASVILGLSELNLPENSEKSLKQTSIIASGKLYTNAARLKLFTREILEGLKYMHSNKVFHCDLKPDNIFIQNGHIKIGDFGLSVTTKMIFRKMQKKLKELKKSNAIDSLSSYGSYMPPELKWNNVKSDMYSFGVILFEMCHPPFLNDTERMNALKPFYTGDVSSQSINTQHKEYIKV